MTAFAVVAMAVALCVPGPAAGATLEVVDALCCSPSADATSEAESASEGERVGAVCDCRCQVVPCWICAVRGVSSVDEGFPSERLDLRTVGAVSAGHRGQMANPPRAPSLSTSPTSTPRRPEQPLFLSLQVLLI